MASTGCTNPFNTPNHSVNNNYPLKRVSLLIQSHAKHIGYDLEIGQRICDKCRLFTRNKYFQSMRNKPKSRPNKRRRFNPKAKTKTYQPPKQNSYMMPESDSSDGNECDDSDEPYSREYHRKQAALRRENDVVGTENNEYPEYVNFSDEDNNTMPDEPTSSMNDNSNSLLSLATQNPTTEIKIVNVTSLSADKHNEILNNDDNAMNATDYNQDDHQLKISEIISTASNSHVFGIAKKAEEPNSLLTVASSKPYRAIPSKTGKKPNSKIQKMKQQLQNNYRLSGAVIPNIDESSASGVGGKVSTDSDDHSNSNANFKTNRRKNTLTPLDCEMEFEEVRPVMKKQAHMSKEQILLSDQLETVKSVKNPNCDLLRKVAFLRVCVNYMMTELEGVEFNFGKNITFEALKSRYERKRSRSMY